MKAYEKRMAEGKVERKANTEKKETTERTIPILEQMIESLFTGQEDMMKATKERLEANTKQCKSEWRGR
jgi:hypothetical protein